VESPEGLPRQPVGVEVVRGALLRAIKAREHGVEYGGGVEAGPVEFYTTTGFIETQVAVIVGPGDRASVGVSASFELPPGVAEKVALMGVELGETAPAKRPGDLGEGVGYIGVLTRGHVTRLDLTVQAVVMALTPWISGWWGQLRKAGELLEALPAPED